MTPIERPVPSRPSHSPLLPAFAVPNLPPMSPTVLALLVAATVLLVAAGRRHGAGRATFLGVLLTVLLLPGLALQSRLVALGADLPDLARAVAVGGFAWGMLAFVAMLGGMILDPRLRTPAWIALVMVPGAVWAAGTFLAIPWVVLSGVLSPWLGLPALGWAFYAVAATGVWTSFVARKEVVRIVLDDDDAGPDVRRLPSPDRTRVPTLPGDALGEGRPLRVVQITDPHLGPFRSEASLRALCERAVAANPDLVLLTGDYFTVEGAGSPDALGRALEPLRALRGRTFACLGNHDHEAPEAVARGLAHAGVRLLVDEAVVVETAAGRVQIVGLDHRWRGRERHGAILRATPRPTGALRVVLLHDPGAFSALPEGEADLVLSGHTHGGHVGLVSLGLDWTAVHAIAGLPDHGLWARGADRLYVHRGTGHYGFPLRIGVPAEESVLEVVRARTA